jgi:glycogen debranching enzyme
MVTDLGGEIEADSEQGVFADDTRFVSYYAIFANGVPWQRLNSAATSYYAARVYLTNAAVATEVGDVPAGTLSLVISRAIGDGIHEDLDLANYGLLPVRFNLEIALRADFADLFEVKLGHVVRRGRIVTWWHEQRAELETSYINRDFRRSLVYRLLNSTSAPGHANGRITFEIELPAGGTWHTCAHYLLVRGEAMLRPRRACYHEGADTEQDRLHERWLDMATKVTTANEDVYRLYRQSVQDMGALCLYAHDLAPDEWLAAAGVPWFVTLFGRDSLIASLQNMIVQAGFARGVLKKLGELQATEMDDARDAEPGKMPHEVRAGELAHFHLIPHTPYYGTVDATPLFLVLLVELLNWSGELDLLSELMPNVLAALEWIDRYGDIDEDGLVEYTQRSTLGVRNQGWKDSWDSLTADNGKPAPLPAALVEVQGYVYHAKSGLARILRRLGHTEIADKLLREAEVLRKCFDVLFWMPDRQFYAQGLDRDKRQVRSISSNPGHALWSGIVAGGRAESVVARLVAPDMFGGWGIRTLSAEEPKFNPMSYHNGSVWPHDNSVIAAGMRRYGFRREPELVARSVLEAGMHFTDDRLPELFCGFTRDRRFNSGPGEYLVSCSPQAWAAGALFHFLQVLCGVEADTFDRRLRIDPLPSPLFDRLRVEGMRVGDGLLDFTVDMDGGQPRVTVDRRPKGLELELPS